jgi:diguanylate cyclase (GGDEF)-like protein
MLTAGLMVAMVLRLGRALRDRVRLQQELAFRAQHDVLTGLANRELFRSSLQAGIDAGGEIGLLIIDLDGFKDVNDTLGHPAGDELLLTATERLRTIVGAASPGARAALLARLGGDEFAIICPPAVLDELAAALVPELAQPYRVAGRELRISASVGVCAGTPASTGEALQSADIALYAAKEAGRNRAVRYHPGLREAHVAHTVLADQLRAAVEAGTGFAVHYQPRPPARRASCASWTAAWHRASCSPARCRPRAWPNCSPSAPRRRLHSFYVRPSRSWAVFSVDGRGTQAARCTG